MIKIQDLKVGQQIVTSGIAHTVSEILEFETGFMVFFEDQKDNPFMSSQYASYSLSALVETV